MTAFAAVVVLHQPVAAPHPLLPFGGLAWAEEAASGGPEAPPGPETDKAETGFVDKLHGELSKRILATADWMDSFFADEGYVKEENRTYMRFRYEVFREERADLSLKPAVDLRLVLPELQRKTNLVISADPAEPPLGAAAPVRTAGERFGTTTQRSLSTALVYFFRQTEEENILVRTGLQFSKFRPVIFFVPRYRYLRPLDPWTYRFTQEVLWRSDTSWETDTRFDFERPLPHDLFFRTTLDGVWAARKNGYLTSLAFTIRHPLAPTHALDYEWVNIYQTRPVGALTDIAFRVRYRHSFWREWLFYELAPQVRFPKDANFRSTPGILFKLEMLFGKN